MAAAAPVASRAHRGAWLLAALLALAALRIGALVLHDPLIGVANNYDMIRVQACIDAYPDRPPDVPPGSNSYDAPLPHYRFVRDVGAPCFLTSEALFAFGAWPALALWAQGSDAGHFPLRIVGVSKAVVLWTLGALFSGLWWRDGRRGWAVGNAAVVALVLADPAVTVYANTFYAEFAAVTFWYATLAAVALVWTRGRAGALACAAIAAVLALAILSKIQHVVLGAFLLGVLGLLQVAGQRAPRRLLGAVAVSAALATCVQLWHMQSPQTRTIREANQTNTFLYAALGLSAHPERTAQALGLPASCAAHAGKSWFSPGVADAHPCPAVLTASRLRIVALLWRDPQTLARMVWTTLERMRAWVAPVLGKVEGRVLAPLPSSQPTLDPLIVAMPTPLFALWLLAPGVLGLAALRPRAALQPAQRLLLLALGLFPWLSLGVVTFGDGLADPAKQSHLALTAAVAFWLVGAMVVGQKIVKKQISAKNISTLA